MSTTSAHALVVGGTGMLREVVLRLAAKGDVVSVIARDAARLTALARDAPTRINPIAVDYSDDEGLAASLADAINRVGPLALAILWLRPGAPRALDTIARMADERAGEGAATKCRLFRILGSAAADPALHRSGNGSRFRAMEGLQYREIILGFRIEGTGSRWNTNAEIAAGVVHAVENDIDGLVVGVVRPWNERPAVANAQDAMRGGSGES